MRTLVLLPEEHLLTMPSYGKLLMVQKVVKNILFLFFWSKIFFIIFLSFNKPTGYTLHRINA